MYIYNEVANFITGQIAKGQLYRCLVDGREEFRGEILPVGTEDDVLVWIKARYKVLGQLFAVDMDSPRGHVIFELGPSLGWDVDTWVRAPAARRYLVEVEGDEKMFVLRPIPEGLLGWHPGRENMPLAAGSA